MLLNILRNSSFLMLWLGQIFSQIAMNMMNFILMLRVFELTSSNTAVSGIILALNLPAAFLGLLAGAYVDRRNKKQVLIACNILRGLFLLPFILAPQNLLIIYVGALLVSTATQFFIPAEAPMIPKLVSHKLLMSANAVFTTSLYSSIVIGFVFAGPALRIFGETYVFVFLAFLFFLAGVFVSLIKVQDAGRSLTSPFTNFATGKHSASNYLTSLLYDLREGYKTLKESRDVFTSLLVLSLSQVAILVLGVLLPGYAKDVLNIAGEDLSFFIFAPASIGMILGALYVGNLGNRFPPRFLITLGTFLAGILIFFLPFSNRFVSKFLALGGFEIDMLYIVVALAVLLGIANSLITVSANTTLQGETQERLQGRIYGAFVALSALFSLLPVALAGGLADLFGVGKILSGLGISILLFALYRVALIKSFKR